jgi:uncharacterized RDD family membrane protein YckC
MPSVSVYAGFWLRFVAWLIDVPILAVMSTVIAVLTLGIGSLFGIIIGWLYYALMESSSNQASLGKMALGLKVTDLNGNRISFGRATGRYFGRLLSGLILGVGFLMIAFTEKKQGLHDMIAETLVVKK